MSARPDVTVIGAGVIGLGRRAFLCSWGCLLSGLVLFVGAVGPWVRIGRFTLSGFEGLGLPIALLACVAVGLAALQVSASRRSVFVILAVFGLIAFGGSVVAWTVLKLFSGSAHLLSLLLARGTHLSAFQNHAPSAGWGLWALSLSAMSLVLSAIAGAGSHTGRAPRAPLPLAHPPVDVYPPVLPVPPTSVSGGFDTEADRLPPRWR